jgi:predicted Zn finger-like uncharacterized protein
MILTCPECASRYFVDDARIGPEGRKVRCASCGHAWRQEADTAAYGALPSLRPSAEPPSEPATATGFEPVTPADEAPVALRGRTAPPVSTRLRVEAAEKRKTREAAAVGAVWAVLGASFCVLGLMAVMFRVDVVRLIPSTAGAYAFAHLPVNAVGLAIEQVQGGPGLEDGHAAMRVSGVVRNVETHPRAIRPLRVVLLDKAQHSLMARIVDPPKGEVQPGETRPFTTSFLDPPLQAAGIQVDFVLDPPRAPARPAKAKATAVKLRGMAPALIPAATTARVTTALKGKIPTDLVTPIPAARIRDAAPLPASSPFALPASAQHAHG